MRVALQAAEVHVEMNPSEEAASASMPLHPARIPPMSGCLSLLAAAAMSACGGGQSTIDSPSSLVSFKANGSHTLMDLDPRSPDVQGSEVLGISKGRSPGPLVNPLQHPAMHRHPRRLLPAGSCAGARPCACARARTGSGRRRHRRPRLMTNTVPAIDTAKIPVGSGGVATDADRIDDRAAGRLRRHRRVRTACQFSHMAFDDPIVYPGQPGKSHLHVFFGNTGTNATRPPTRSPTPATRRASAGRSTAPRTGRRR
jgi:hypothetical protein